MSVLLTNGTQSLTLAMGDEAATASLAVRDGSVVLAISFDPDTSVTATSAAPAAITLTAYPATVSVGAAPATVTSAAPAAITMTGYAARVTVDPVIVVSAAPAGIVLTAYSAAVEIGALTVTSASPAAITLTQYAPLVSAGPAPLVITSAAPAEINLTGYAATVQVVDPVTVTSASPVAITMTAYAASVTVPDETAPVVSAAWDEANNEIDLTITEVNFPVTIRWQIRAIATAAPDEAAMLAGTGAILNGSYSAASTPDSEVIDVSSLSDATEYTLYVMASDPSANHSAISDSDFTYSAPVTVASAAPAAITMTGYAAAIVVDPIIVTSSAPAEIALASYPAAVEVNAAPVTATSGAPASIVLTGYGATVSVTGGVVTATSASPNAITLTAYAPNVFAGDTWTFDGSVVTNLPTAPAWTFDGSVVTQIPDAA